MYQEVRAVERQSRLLGRQHEVGAGCGALEHGCGARVAAVAGEVRARETKHGLTLLRIVERLRWDEGSGQGLVGALYAPPELYDAV